MSTDVRLEPSVAKALAEAAPVVALESALISHGFAYPANLDIVRRMMGVVEETGAKPAIVAIWDGQPVIGLSSLQLADLATDFDAAKVSLRDLGLISGRVGHGGTTVAATAFLAQRVGIQVFATGGIGGVHRGHPDDVSADLSVLASTPMIVVCAGAKSILDLPRTLEYLETWGVPVLGWQTDEFPAFYSRGSGLPVDLEVTEAAEVVRVFQTQRALELPQAVLVTVPVPIADEVPIRVVEPLISQALAEAEAQGIVGKSITPFILERLVELSGNRTRQANESLLANNARVAAQIAAALSSV